MSIKKSRRGTLRRIAARNGGILPNGKISKAWAREHVRTPGVRAPTQRQILVVLNMH